MLRRLPGLALSLFLALPGAALAAEPAPPTVTGHYYYIAAVEQGGQTIKVEGKLWVEGDQLGASVGCNSIGATVSFDGRTLIIKGDIATTLMGCPDELAAAEAALVTALSVGSFIFDGSGFDGKIARIVATNAATVPIHPRDQQPPDKVSDPDGPISRPIIEPGIGLDPEACREYLPAKEWEAVFGSGAGGGASGGEIGTNPGSRPVGGNTGADTPGSPGGTGVVDPGTGGVSTPGSTGTGQADPSTVREPAPVPSDGSSEPEPQQPETPPSDDPGQPGPAVEPDPAPVASSAVEPDPAPSDGTSTTLIVPAPSLVMPLQPLQDGGGTDGREPAIDMPAIDLPVDRPADKPPVGTVTEPAPTPGAETCRQLLAQIRTIAGAPPTSTSDVSHTAAGAEMAAGDGMATRDTVTTSVPPALAAILVIVSGIVMLAWLRSIPGRRHDLLPG